MLERAQVLVVVLFVLAASCGGDRQRADGGARKTPPAAMATPPSVISDEGTSGEGGPRTSLSARVERPKGLLTVAEARRYMVSLLNRDRASEGLPPVLLDEGPPTLAGQAHAEDMAHLGFLGHWGSDGSVPEHRHTRAGGVHMVLENASCFTDEKTRVLDPAPKIDPAEVEKAQAQFFDEVPPNDGHRQNILRPHHTHVGIGIAQPVSTKTEIGVPCFTQELVDAYGSYAPIPKAARVGAKVRVAGTLTRGARPVGVGVARVPLPAPLPPNELNKRRSYPVPTPYQTYWGPGFKTPIPVQIDGARFSVEVPLDDRGQAGLYEVSVWAKLAGQEANTMVSLRTVTVTGAGR
jgi:uncharacterized protein YkwD